MSRPFTLAVLSDIHYYSAAEQVRGDDYEINAIANPVTRRLLRTYRRYVWLGHPLGRNRQFESFLKHDCPADGVVVNGDYSCDSAFVGVSDDPTCQSAKECLGRLREKFGAIHATIGDHELGKFSFIGMRGGLRLASYRRAREELALKPFWWIELGRYVLLGVTSSLVALPAFESEALAEELPEWRRLREEHLAEIRRAFSELSADQRVLLFCHDPTALPFLWREDAVRARIPQIEQTIIGHLHSNLILWKSRLLAGMPRIRFLGHAGRRISAALKEARHWKPFRVRLCPALAGIELLNDGGYLKIEFDFDAQRPARFHFQRLLRD